MEGSGLVFSVVVWNLTSLSVIPFVRDCASVLALCLALELGLGNSFSKFICNFSI